MACGGVGGASPVPSIPRSLPRDSSVAAAVALAFACWRRRAAGLALAVGRRIVVTGSLESLSAAAVAWSVRRPAVHARRALAVRPL
eukprot:3045494-Prorocentrum_lima.AAC.1